MQGLDETWGYSFLLPPALCVSPHSHNKMFRRKGRRVPNQVHTYCCPQQHDICFLQGTRDAVCPHMPSRSPVKHQGEDPKWEDGSSKAEGFPVALSPVAKYLLGQNQNDPIIGKAQ